MQSFHPEFFKQVRLFVLFVLLFSGAFSCQYIPTQLSSFFNNESAATDSEPVNEQKIQPVDEQKIQSVDEQKKQPVDEQKKQSADNQKKSGMSKIYIQNFSGQKVKDVQEIFFKAVKEQSHFTFMELLPDNLEQLGVLRIDVTDFNIWEIDEKASDFNNSQSVSINPDEPIKRINAIVSLKVNLFEAKTGKLLINRRFSQPFQQIYVGKEMIEKRPDNSIELDRLTKLLIFSMLDSFLSMEEKVTVLQYEKGLGHDWFATKVHNFGHRRIQKGIRLAMAGDLDEAIWIWKIILFSPIKDEPKNIYLHNRASTYYNLGIAYQLNKDWWRAAEMFSHANRIQQKLKYAQAWGNSIQLWLEEQRNPPSKKKASPIVKTEIKKVESDEKAEPMSAISIEKNDQMLLKPRILWPLDPHLKKREQLKEGEKFDQ